MPSEQRFRLHNQEGLPPVLYHAGENHQPVTVSNRQYRTFALPMQNQKHQNAGVNTNFDALNISTPGVMGFILFKHAACPECRPSLLSCIYSTTKFPAEMWQIQFRSGRARALTPVQECIVTGAQSPGFYTVERCGE